MTERLLVLAGAAAATAVAAAGCGGGRGGPAAVPSTSSAPASTASGSTRPGGSAPAPTPSAAGALTAEARAAAGGDIPDNQVFLGYRNVRAGYSIRFPQGWARRGSDRDVRFSDKNNIVQIVVSAGSKLDAARVRADLRRVRATTPSFRAGPVSAVALPAGPAFKTTYTTESSPSPVTGKRVTLNVDRYYLFRGGKRAIVDLGGPQGVDNVDAYRLIVESFRWQ